MLRTRFRSCTKESYGGEPFEQENSHISGRPSSRRRRDVPGMAYFGGGDDQVIDPFDASNYLLKWEHGILGLHGNQVQKGSRYPDYRNDDSYDYYAPLHRNRFGKTRHVLNDNSHGFSGDLFGSQITTDFYKRKRKKRSTFDSDVANYDSYSDVRVLKNYLNSFPKLSNTDLDKSLIYPLDFTKYYGMIRPIYRNRHSKLARDQSRETKQPKGKILDFSGVDLAFRNPQQKPNGGYSPEFNFHHEEDPDVSTPFYGYYPDYKDRNYQKTHHYHYPSFKNLDRVSDADYNEVGIFPVVGNHGYVGSNSGNQNSNPSTGPGDSVVPLPIPDEIQVVPAVVPTITATSTTTTTTTARTTSTSIKNAITQAGPTQAGILRSTAGVQTKFRIKNTTPFRIPKTTQQTRTTPRPECCQPCDPSKVKHCYYPYHIDRVTPPPYISTTTCYDKKHLNTKTPHYHHPGQHPATLPPVEKGNVWTESEILKKLDAWLKAMKGHQTTYEKIPKDQWHDYSNGRTSPIPPVDTSTKHPRRIITQSPDKSDGYWPHQTVDEHSNYNNNNDGHLNIIASIGASIIHQSPTNWPGSDMADLGFEDLGFTPELLTDINYHKDEISEIHDSLPIDQAMVEKYKKHIKIPRITTPNPLDFDLDSLPSATPKWLRGVISKFMKSKRQNIPEPKYMMHKSNAHSSGNKLKTVGVVSFWAIGLSLALSLWDTTYTLYISPV